jgi:hypothetical protein
VKPRARMQHFLFQAFKNIILQFGLVCCQKMLYENLPLLLAQIFAINMFSFGDVNNTPRYWVKSLQKHIIILKLRNVFILCVKNYPKGKKTKHCSLMIKPFQIPSVVASSSLSYVKGINCQEIRSNGWTLCLVCDQC